MYQSVDESFFLDNLYPKREIFVVWYSISLRVNFSSSSMSLHNNLNWFKWFFSVFVIFHINFEKSHYNLKTSDLFNRQIVLKILFQIDISKKLRENVKTVLKIIFSTVLAFSRDCATWKEIFSTLCVLINLKTSNCNGPFKIKYST